MHRVMIVLLGVSLAACDPVVHDTLRVTPVNQASGASASAGPADVLSAVEHVALRFGLKPDQSGTDSVTRTWRGPAYEKGRPQQLYVYANRAADGMVTVTVGEIITRTWSPRGDSLRRAITDTLQRFGSVTP